LECEIDYFKTFNAGGQREVSVVSVELSQNG